MKKKNLVGLVSSALAVMALSGCGGDDNDLTGIGANASTATATSSGEQSNKIAALKSRGDRVGSTPIDDGTSVHVALMMQLNNRAELESIVAQNHESGASAKAAALSHEQITRYTPSAQQVATVTDYLKKKGFTNIKVADNNMIVEADGPAKMVSRVFKTSLVGVTKANGRSAHINTSRETVPAALNGLVYSAMGLDTATEAHTHYKEGPAISSIAAKTAAGGASTNADTLTTTGHNMLQFMRYYNAYSRDATAANPHTVGIIAAGDLTQAPLDLQAAYRGFFDGYVPPVSVIYAGTKGTDTSNNLEWALDSQVIVGIGNHSVKQLNFYAATSMAWSDITVAINRAVSDNTAKIVNVSLGGCETYAPTTAIDQILLLAQAQGQTFSVSTGDSGSTAYGCSSTSVEYPASSPYVVAVGGTTLYSSDPDGELPNYSGRSYSASETAWSLSSDGSGGGGGISTIEPMPSWQANVPLLSGKTKRAIPDIAYDANPYSGVKGLIVNGTTYPNLVGGTSLAAPLFAGSWARIITQQTCPNAAVSLYQTLPGWTGWTSPVGYPTTNSGFLYDVTSGSIGAYSAGAGWDYATGWGSLALQQTSTYLINFASCTAA